MAQGTAPTYPTIKTTQAVAPENANDWVSPANIGADDGVYASITAATYDLNDISYRLKAQGFGFSIPLNATIVGIVAQIERRCAAGGAKDYRVQLLDEAGALVGNNKAVVDAWESIDTLKDYGTSTDLWGWTTVTPAKINDPDFGVVLSVQATANNTDIYVDYIRITVFYSSPSSVETLRPDAAGDETSIPTQYPNSTYHWDKVDEETSDSDTTYISCNSTTLKRDLYNLPAHSVGSGTINFVKVYAVGKNLSVGGGWAQITLGVKSGATLNEEVVDNLATTYTAYSLQWNTDPDTGAAWTWNAIDALQVGVALKVNSTDNSGRITQVYVEVDYTPPTLFYQNVGGGAITPVGVLTILPKIQMGQGSITPSSTLIRLPKIQMGQGVITPTGVLGRLIKIAVGGGNITPVGALTAILKFFQNVGQGAITPVGVLGRNIFKAVGSGVITPAGTLARLIKIQIGGGIITPSGVLTRLPKLLVGQGIITPVGTLGRNIFKSVGAGIITPTGTLARKISIAVGLGSITPTGVLTSILTIFQTVGQGIITPIGTLSRKILIVVGGGSITPVGILGRFIKITIGAGVVTPVGVLGRKIFIAIGTGAVAIAGALSLKIKITVGGGTITPIGILTKWLKVVMYITSLIRQELTITSSIDHELTITSSIARELTITSSIEGG